MTFNPQELNQRITLQQKFTGQDPNTGIQSTEWLDREDLWAKAEGAVGRTRFEASAAGFVDPVNFTVRFIGVYQFHHPGSRFRGTEMIQGA